GVIHSEDSPSTRAVKNNGRRTVHTTPLVITWQFGTVMTVSVVTQHGGQKMDEMKSMEAGQYANPYFDWPAYVKEKMEDEPLIRDHFLSRGFTLHDIMIPFDLCHVAFAALATEASSDLDLVFNASEAEKDALWLNTMTLLREKRPFVYCALHFAMDVALTKRE